MALAVCAASAVCGACGPEVRTFDVRGLEPSAVFIVHVDAGETPSAVDGPFFIDEAGNLSPPIRDQPARDETTVMVPVSLAALESQTAAIDPTHSKRRRFQQDAPCWVAKSCEIEAFITAGPQELTIQREATESVGSIVLPATVEVLPDSFGPGPTWLSQVQLRLPFDLELIEPERTRVFGNVEEWAAGLRFGGIRDFVPLTQERVVVVTINRACIVESSTPLEQICAPGPKTISIADHVVVPSNNFFQEIVRQPDFGTDTATTYLSIDGPTPTLLRAEVTGGEFTLVEEFHQDQLPMDNLAISPGGTMVVTTASNSEEIGGKLSAIEFKQGRVVHSLVATNPARYEDAIDRAILTVTGDDSFPFVVGLTNAFAVRLPSGDIDWQSQKFLQDEPESLKSQAIAAVMTTRPEDPDQLMVLTAFRDGIMFRFGQADDFLLPSRIDLTMPKGYLQDCEATGQSGQVLTIADFRGLVLRNEHEAFALVDGCAVVLQFDPNPLRSSPEAEAVSVYYGDALAEGWPTLDGDVPDHIMELFRNELWIGGGATLRRVSLDSGMSR